LLHGRRDGGAARRRDREERRSGCCERLSPESWSAS
jgi:hypothetical protein